MGTLTLEYDIEKKLKTFNLKEFFLGFVSGHISSYQISFKNDLKEMFINVKNVADDIGQIKDMDIVAVKKLYIKYQKTSVLFDKLNDLYHSSNYFNDEELKQLFRSISRNLHRIENISERRLFEPSTSAPTPDYIKEGLAQFSRDTLTNKLNSNL